MKLSIHFLYSTFFSTARIINCYEVKWTYYVHELLNLWILKRFIFVKTFGLVKCNNLIVVITQSIEYCSHPTGLLFREVLWYYQVMIRKGKKWFSVIFPKEHLKNAKLNWGKRIYSLERPVSSTNSFKRTASGKRHHQKQASSCLLTNPRVTCSRSTIRGHQL